MSISTVPHDFVEYSKVGLMASGGAAIALQTLIKKSSPQKIASLFSRLVNSSPTSPQQVHRKLEWMHRNQEKIVTGVGFIAATYKGIEDTRENQLQWKSQQELNQTQQVVNNQVEQRLNMLESRLEGYESLKNENKALKDRLIVLETELILVREESHKQYLTAQATSGVARSLLNKFMGV